MIEETTRRRVLHGVATAVPLGLAGCLGAGDGSQSVDESLSVESAHLYSAPGCSCCGQYADYLRERLDAPLDESSPADVAAIKREHGVPERFQSCHTVVLDEYVVEGHVPVVTIETLLADAPPIDGIALPGMPAGSPGMGGQKRGPFTVYALGGDRTGEVFAER